MPYLLSYVWIMRQGSGNQEENMVARVNLCFHMMILKHYTMTPLFQMQWDIQTHAFTNVFGQDPHSQKRKKKCMHYIR